MTAIGCQYDNNAERVQFILPQFEGGTATLHLHLGAYADIVELPADGVFTVMRTHTQHPGGIAAHVTIQAGGEVVWHSGAFALYVDPVQDDGPLIQQAYPTAIEGALRAAAEAGADREAVEAARTAVEAALDAVEKISVTAETLPPGAAATAGGAFSAETGLALALGIPRGEPGIQGLRGPQGERGEAGPQGPVGPNQLSASTGTALTGLLKGAEGHVAQAVPGSDYARPSAALTGTLLASNWGEDGTQTVALAGLAAGAKGILGLGDALTDAQAQAALGAQLVKTAQAEGSVTVKAFGAAPEVDIPIQVLIVG